MKTSVVILGIFILLAAIYAQGTKGAEQVGGSSHWQFKQIKTTSLAVDPVALAQENPTQAEFKDLILKLSKQVESSEKQFEAGLRRFRETLKRSIIFGSDSEDTT